MMRVLLICSAIVIMRVFLGIVGSALSIALVAQGKSEADARDWVQQHSLEVMDRMMPG
jgi:hypothetical protein